MVGGNMVHLKTQVLWERSSSDQQRTNTVEDLTTTNSLPACVCDLKAQKTSESAV